ncbi:MAG: RNA 2',3'-cyclic phosphodiesterase, partial [Thermoleophilaceae bacterium]
MEAVLRRTAPATRLFLALDLPDDVRGRLVSWRDAALAGRDEELRPVPAEALHVTLVFLGGVEAPDVGAVADTALDALAGVAAPVLAPTGVRGVPARRTRLLALDLADEDGRAAVLASTAAAALAACGLHEPERRPFWAHLTLARVRSGRRLGRGE